MSDFTSNEPYSDKKVYASELYDYEKDPLEKVNVVKDKKYAIIEKDMNAKMLAFFKTNQK